jgi:serine protease Do
VNARVVGVSECADLAVIDLAGDGYPYLARAEKRPTLGATIHAAGYPLGEPDYVLTQGEVIERNAWGESDWASLETVIAHNARIRPGNSGGPLLDGSGAVVGVNYARNTAVLRNRSFSIPTDAALSLLDRLIAGENVDSLGINGVALDEEGRTGIWVASVASGSAADRAGVLPGDLLYEIEGVQVGIGGDMRDYCDIIRSHGAGDTLALKLYREQEDAVFAGQLNGPAVARARGERYPPERRGVALRYTTHGDASGVIRFDAPAHWGEVLERDWVYQDRVVGRQLIVAPDIDGFFDDWSVAGIAVSWSFTLGQETTTRVLAQKPDFSDVCDQSDRYSDRVSEGLTFDARFYLGCDRGTAAIVAALADEYGDLVVKIEFYATTDEEFDAYAMFYESLNIDFDAATRAAASQYITVKDSTERIWVAVPHLWTDQSSEPVEDRYGEELGRALRVSTDVDEYSEYWGVPGISIWLFDDLELSSREIDEWLDDSPEIEACDGLDDRYSFDGERLRGKYDLWTECFRDGEGYFAQFILVTNTGDTVAVDLSLPNDAYLAYIEPMLRSLFALPAATSLPPVGRQASAAAVVTILADRLNVRSGPGTGYDIVTVVVKGDQGDVLAQFDSCAWLLVPLGDGRTGWISGDEEHTRLDSACSAIPARSGP